MVSPARRGRSDVALGNVVGTTIVLLTLNLGLIALIRPIAADPWVLQFHVPYLIVCVLLVGAAFSTATRLGRGTGAMLILLYLVLSGDKPKAPISELHCNLRLEKKIAQCTLCQLPVELTFNSYLGSIADLPVGTARARAFSTSAP